MPSKQIFFDTPIEEIQLLSTQQVHMVDIYDGVTADTVAALPWHVRTVGIDFERVNQVPSTVAAILRLNLFNQRICDISNSPQNVIEAGGLTVINSPEGCHC